jgi:hypothetical protein
MSNQEIFVSYAWKGESEALVNKLCAAFASKDYRVIRDKSAMTYKDSIKNFMDSIGRGKFIIAVVGNKYMKSEYCMYEAYRMFQSPAFGERVFPIVLPDADIFSFRGQAAYLKYWHQEYKALEAEYKEISDLSPTMVGPLTDRLRDIEATTRFINDFMAAISDMNVLTSQTHLESNFSQLLQAIEERMQHVEQKAGEEEDSPSIHRQESAGSSFNVQNVGNSAIAQGTNAKAVGAGGVLIEGDVSGSNIVVGNNNQVNTNGKKKK